MNMNINRLKNLKGVKTTLAVIAVMAVCSALFAAESSNPIGSNLSRLADLGEFDHVLALLKSDTLYNKQDPSLAALVSDLERYQKNQTKRDAEQLKAYREALDNVSLHQQDHKLEEALASAVNAHNLAADRAELLQNPTIQQLTKQAENTAKQAEDNHDWVESVSLYRALTLLFDDPSRYRDKIKKAGKHLRIIRLYTPQHLQALYAARAERLGKDKPNFSHTDNDTWQDRLKDITMSMLRQTLAQSARRHVSNKGYAPLLRGALNGVIVLTQTQGLEDVFPAFNDPVKLGKFQDGLVKLRDGLEHRKRPLNFLDAATIIDRITALNDRTTEIPDRVLIYELTEGATGTLDDFSSVIWPREKEIFSRNTRGKFFGVGIQISIRDEQLIVVSPLEDTPAQRAGIQAGDIIATVDDKNSSNWSLDRAVREITGPQGTRVTLGISRAGEPDLIHYDLTRAEIAIESIRGWQRKTTGGWDYFIDPDQRIGYVRLSQFIPQSAGDLDKAMNEMEKDGLLNGLILDLRFNPGGLLSSAVEVSDRFISSGPIVSTVGADGRQTSQFRARPDHTHKQLPIVVLVNEGSASASEILSGALQDYQRALILGTRSFGKGSVQDLFRLSGEKAYLKLTTQHYMLPRGRIIHREPTSKVWGIEPNLTVKMTTKQITDALEFRQKVDVLHNEDELAALNEPAPTADQILEKGLDPQIEAALLVLKTRLVAKHLALAQGPAAASP